MRQCSQERLTTHGGPRHMCSTMVTAPNAPSPQLVPASAPSLPESHQEWKNTRCVTMRRLREQAVCCCTAPTRLALSPLVWPPWCCPRLFGGRLSHSLLVPNLTKQNSFGSRTCNEEAVGNATNVPGYPLKNPRIPLLLSLHLVLSCHCPCSV